MYLDVAGRSTTDLSMMLTDLQPLLYNCPDRHGVFANMQQAAGKQQSLMTYSLSNVTLSISLYRDSMQRIYRFIEYSNP